MYQHGDGVAVEETYKMEGEAEEIEGGEVEKQEAQEEAYEIHEGAGKKQKDVQSLVAIPRRMY